MRCTATQGCGDLSRATTGWGKCTCQWAGTINANPIPTIIRIISECRSARGHRAPRLRTARSKTDRCWVRAGSRDKLSTERYTPPRKAEAIIDYANENVATTFDNAQPSMLRSYGFLHLQSLSNGVESRLQMEILHHQPLTLPMQLKPLAAPNFSISEKRVWLVRVHGLTRAGETFCSKGRIFN